MDYLAEHIAQQRKERIMEHHSSWLRGRTVPELFSLFDAIEIRLKELGHGDRKAEVYKKGLADYDRHVNPASDLKTNRHSYANACVKAWQNAGELAI